MQIGWCGSDDHVGPIRLPNLTLKLTFCVRKKEKDVLCVGEWMNESVHCNCMCFITLPMCAIAFSVPAWVPHFIVGDSVVTREPLLWESSEKQKKKKIWQKEFDIS